MPRPAPKSAPREKRPRRGLRRTPLARGSAKLRRAVRIRPVNPERKARVRGDEVYGAYHQHVGTEYFCLAADHPDHECVGEVVGHHLKRVGKGGKDFANEVPVCAQLHEECHASEARVERRYGVRLQEIAERIALRWQAFVGSPAYLASRGGGQ